MTVGRATATGYANADNCDPAFNPNRSWLKVRVLLSLHNGRAAITSQVRAAAAQPPGRIGLSASIQHDGGLEAEDTQNEPGSTVSDLRRSGIAI